MLCAGLLLATHAAAQTKLPGRVIDAQERPVAGLEVLLHAVEAQAGNQVDRDTTISDGSFDLEVKALNPNAVYFVAVTYEGQLYMGDLMRPPFPLDKDYVVQVGVNPVDLSPQAAGTDVTPQEREKDRSAGIGVIIAAAAVITALVFAALRRRPPVGRRLLVELARLEEEIEASGEDIGLLKRRAELRSRLRAPKAG